MDPAIFTSLVDDARRDFESLYTSTCDVTRGSYPDTATVHSGIACMVRPAERVARVVEAGGSTVALHLYDVYVPHGSDVQQGDVVTVTASRDSDLVGRWLTVMEVVNDDYMIRRRLLCQEGRT